MIFDRARALTAAGAVAAACLLTSCAQQLQDLESDAPGVTTDERVDSTTVYRNIDGFPNLAITCVEGVAFVTASSGRADGASGNSGRFERVAELDEHCARVEAERRDSS